MIKDYLRSIMGQDQLSGMSIISAEQRAFDNDRHHQNLCRQKPCKLNLWNICMIYSLGSFIVENVLNIFW